MAKPEPGSGRSRVRFVRRVWPFEVPALWTRRQQRVAAGLVLFLSTALFALRLLNPVTVPDPPPAVGDRAGELLARLDPNTADAVALSAIPKLGPTGADNVVAYRTAYARGHPGRPAFTRPDDLMLVRRIGVATRDAIAPYLRFPPTTRP